MSIKIKTRNIGRSADLWGYTLRVNGLFLKIIYDGYHNESPRLTDRIEGATVFSTIASLRKHWNEHKELIVYYSKQLKNLTSE